MTESAEAMTTIGSRVRAQSNAVATLPIRACMVSFYFHPNYSGSAIQALNLSKRLRQLGVQPTILSANLSQSPAHEVVDGIPLYRVPVAMNENAQIPSFWLSAARLLWRMRHEFDVIHAHGTVQHGVASVMGNLLKKPAILKVAMADSDLAFARQGRVFGGLNRFMVGRFDRYIATTHDIQDEFAARGLDRERVRLIPNGVDTDVFSPVDAGRKAELKRELGFSPAPLVTCVAVLNSRKNIDGVLRIFQTVVTRGTSAQLAIIGPPPSADDAYCRTLREFVDAHGLADRVRFLGKVMPVAPYLQASDAFLFPSKREGMPNAVIEAMASGLACLVSDSAGTADLIESGVTGYSFDAADEAGFADRLEALLVDESLRARLGQQARQRVSARLSLESIAVRYRELYDEMLLSKAGGR